MKRKLVPDVVKSQELILVSEDTSVATVSKMMADNNIGAVLVVKLTDYVLQLYGARSYLQRTQGKRAVGIVSIRDLFKVAYEHLMAEQATA